MNKHKRVWIGDIIWCISGPVFVLFGGLLIAMMLCVWRVIRWITRSESL